MGCERCDAFDTEVLIPTPGVLRSVGQKVRNAIDNGTLSYNSFESSRELLGQPSFMSIDLSGKLPDVLRYHFNCKSCGNCYGLFIETYHGSGGRWFRTRNSPLKTRFRGDAFKRVPFKSVSIAFTAIASVIGLVLILGWAISTVFEVAMIKAFAIVILGVVAVACALLLAGVA